MKTNKNLEVGFTSTALSVTFKNYFIIEIRMKKLLQIIGAAWGAKKIGGGKCGCVGTLFVFIILYVVLGYVLEWF